MVSRLLLAFALAGPAGVAQGESLRVMSFNMLCGICAPLGYGGWDERVAGLQHTLRRAHPDLLAAQELAVEGNLATIARALPKMTAHHLHKAWPHYDSTVFYDRERFQLLDQGGFWLSAQPDDPVGLGWKPLSVVWVKLRDRAGGSEFYFAGTHVDNNRANKQPSLELIRRRLGALADAPVILAADFNLKPSAGSLRILGEKGPGGGFVDSLDLAGRATAVGGAGLEFGCTDDRPRSFPECRIDHILLSRGTDWRVARYTVDLNRYGWRRQFISDHRAIWADVHWERGPTVKAASAVQPGTGD